MGPAPVMSRFRRGRKTYCGATRSRRDRSIRPLPESLQASISLVSPAQAGQSEQDGTDDGSRRGVDADPRDSDQPVASGPGHTGRGSCREVLAESLGVGAAQTQFSAPGTIRPTAADSLYEIVNGQRLELLPMSAYGTWLASRLDQQIGPYSERELLGTSVTEMLFVLDKARDLRRRPNVAFVSTERWSRNREFPLTGDWEVVPDLAVEVVSPNDLANDLLA